VTVLTRARSWLLYGAYGYTGRLLAAEALARGHRPILAGRSEEKLRRLREELADGAAEARACEIRAFPLQGPALDEGLRGMEAVFHAAGPFVETGVPMMEACLKAGVHYLDITGEVPVFEAAFHRDERAREANIVLLPGVGLDVIPTDGAAALLAAALPSASRLELALHSPGRPSGGTLQTIVEGVPGGLLVRRGGRLERAWPGRREFRRQVSFGPEPALGPMAGRLGGARSVAPYTWGDLSTAWRTTGIGDITCYLTTPASQRRLLPWVLPLLRQVTKVRTIRQALRSRIQAGVTGPDAHARSTGRTRVWGRVEDKAGRWEEVLLEFPEGYRFTSLAGIRALEAVLDARPPAGTLTPAGAFGVEWVLGLPEVEVVARRSRE
jgi:short subunit dehydrogenase-like uncharacterized protein